MKLQKSLTLAIAPLLALGLFLLMSSNGINPNVAKMAGLALWIAIWWLTEAVHLAVTSLLPIIFLPILGIADSKTTAQQYMDPIIFLFIGGFIIAFAIEKWELHKRIAYKILQIVGVSTSRILFGIMLTSFLLSMWISNTATVMMLISAVIAIILQVENLFSEEKHSHNFSTAVLIGLAYSATIGGMATLVGTPTNMIFYREYVEKYSGQGDLNFFTWFAIGFPIALLFLIVTFFILKRLFLKNSKFEHLPEHHFGKMYQNLGKMSFEEIVISIIFLSTAVLWFTRADIDFGIIKLYGWNNFFAKKEFLQDSTVAIAMAVLLFIIPAKSKPNRAILVWDDVKKLPFGIILLFGGGFALAKGFELSGLTIWLGSQLQFVAGANIYLVILLLCVLITIISEFASNVACIQLMLPILIAMQHTMGVNPLMLMIPATLASSLGFMLPVATAPNTIVYGSGKIKTKDMLKAGLLIDIVGIIIISLFSFLIK